MFFKSSIPKNDFIYLKKNKNLKNDLIYSTHNFPKIEDSDFTGKELTGNKQYK